MNVTSRRVVDRIRPNGGSGHYVAVVILGAYQETVMDFIADNTGPMPFHCHQHLHMNYGFMALLGGT